MQRDRVQDDGTDQMGSGLSTLLGFHAKRNKKHLMDFLEGGPLNVFDLHSHTHTHTC